MFAAAAPSAAAAPKVTRLTPPSELFSSNRPTPIIARFLPEQRFDLQATVQPDDPSRSITAMHFEIDGRPVTSPVTLRDCTSGCVKEVANNAVIASVRAVNLATPGVRQFSVTATQNDGQTVTARGNFEIVPLLPGGQKVRNIIILLGDGMGTAHRTAARIVLGGYAQGKVRTPLAMDSFPVTALVKTASLNSIVTDSSPGMTAYVLGNKNDNNEEGVFPDDTLDAFDNPRIEYLSELLHRTQGKALGIVTTADVFDSTPAGNAVHTSSRGAGTGIVDQFLDDHGLTGLAVLMGGGRKWFLPSTEPGSARGDRSDYALAADVPHTAELARAWGAAPGAVDKDRDLLADFQRAGFGYAPDKTALDAFDPQRNERLLGLFALGNMNVALDKINGRRGLKTGINGSVVDDYGFPDQPMLDEMATKALAVLSRKPNGFVLMVEGASIDKQAHAMDSERWLLDLLEFDRAVKVAQDFAARDNHTLVIVTADHETGGTAVLGASRVTDVQLRDQAAKGGKENLRDPVVGIYERAGFPRYTLAADGYPQNTDIDRKLLIGYGANADRSEGWRTHPRPLRDGQQPFAKQEPMNSYPGNPLVRDKEGGYLVTGQVPGTNSAHTGTDVPLSAFGPGAWSFTGVIDNTDVFFKLAQAALGGVVLPPGLIADLQSQSQTKPQPAATRKTIPRPPRATTRQ
ncbi:MAG: alkaline phosphatase [Rubrivivax sp.]